MQSPSVFSDAQHNVMIRGGAVTWHEVRCACVQLRQALLSYWHSATMAMQGRERWHQGKVEHGEQPVKGMAEVPAGTKKSGRQAAENHSSDVPPVSKRDEAPGGELKRTAGAPAKIIRRDAVSRQNNVASMKRRRAADVAVVAKGAGQARPLAWVPKGQKAPYGTWLTLPDPPATAAEGAAQQQAPAEGHVAGSSAAVRGLAAARYTAHGTRPNVADTPAEATCAAFQAPSAVGKRPARNVRSAAARGGVAMAASAIHSAERRRTEVPAGAAGAGRQIAPYEIENRLIDGGMSLSVHCEAMLSAPLRGKRLSRPAGSAGPQQACSRSPSAPSQIPAPVTMRVRQSLPPQLPANASLKGRSAVQRPMTPSSVGVHSISAAAASARSVGKCRYCALHGIVTVASPMHRAACQYFSRCPCFKCRKLHLRNTLNAEVMVRKRKATAVATAAARRNIVGVS